MAATIVRQIVTTVVDVISVKGDELRKIFSDSDEEAPVIVISAIGMQDIGKSTLLNFVMAFLKGGCNHSWAVNGDTKLEGFLFGKNKQRSTISGGINAFLVPIEFDGYKMQIIVLDVDIDTSNEYVSVLNSKLQMICSALSTTLIYIMPHSGYNALEADQKISALMNRYAQYFAANNLSRSSVYTMLSDTPDNLLSCDAKENMLKTKPLSFIHQDYIKSLQVLFEKKSTVLMPQFSKSMPDDFQGELKHLEKKYKTCLKSFLMDSFSITTLLAIVKKGKCYKSKNEFLIELKHLIEISNGNSIPTTFNRGERNGIPGSILVKKSYPPHEAPDLDKCKEMGVQEMREDNFEFEVDAVENRLAKSRNSLAENIERCDLQILDVVHTVFLESIKYLDAVKNINEKKRNKMDEKLHSTLNNKINMVTIEKNCINQLRECQTLIKQKFAQQLYYQIQEFDNWLKITKRMIVGTVKNNRCLEIPQWFDPYINKILRQADSLNKEIRETERQAVDEAVSIGLEFYERKMRQHVQLLIFKEEELKDMDSRTLNIVKQSLEYGMQLENQKNVALDEFQAMESVKKKSKVILEILKSDFMQSNYTSLLGNADSIAKRAFAEYQTHLQRDINGISNLKVTQLYEFHVKAKENALNLFYKNLCSFPKEIAEGTVTGLAEDIDREHKRIRNLKVQSTLTTAETPILGIQFGLAEIRFGIFRNGNPQLYKQKISSGIPNYISLSEGFRFGTEAAEYDPRNGSQFKMEDVLKDKVGTVYDAIVLGNPKKLQQEVLVSLIFGFIKSDAAQKFEEDIYKCIISVPNGFDHVQRQMIKDSATLAGFDVLKILCENAAAAVTFRFAPEFKNNRSREVNLLVNSYASEYEVDSSSVFKVTKEEIVMLSSCSAPFVNELKNGGFVASVVGLFRKSPSDNDIMFCDATEKSQVNIDNGILVKSGKGSKFKAPTTYKTEKFCGNVSTELFSNSIVYGTIYYGEAINTGLRFAVSETLQYGIALELSDKSKKETIERNVALPMQMDFKTFALTNGTSSSVILYKLQGKKSQLGSYSIDARHKPANYNSGQLSFSFDQSGLLTTKGFILTANGKEDVFVTQEADNMNGYRKREIMEQVKEIRNLEKMVNEQKHLRANLKKELARIKSLVDSRKSLSPSYRKMLERTLSGCHEVLKDETSNSELLQQNLESLKKAEEIFLQ